MGCLTLNASFEPLTILPVERALRLVIDRKAEDITLLDLREVSGATDFFIIATGRSDTHVSAIGDYVVDELKNERGLSDPRIAAHEDERGGHEPAVRGR